jgi:L-alanine-DL-glutamate epimerase-like enolase superfamily enzyme
MNLPEKGPLATTGRRPRLRRGAEIRLRILADCPNRSYLEAHGFGLERYIAEPLQIADGYAIAPRRPGHGVEFDWRSLDRVKA